MRACNEEWGKLGLKGNLWTLLMMHYPWGLPLQRKIPPWINCISASSMRTCNDLELSHLSLIVRAWHQNLMSQNRWILSQDSEWNPQNNKTGTECQVCSRYLSIATFFFVKGEFPLNIIPFLQTQSKKLAGMKINHRRTLTLSTFQRQ